MISFKKHKACDWRRFSQHQDQTSYHDGRKRNREAARAKFTRRRAEASYRPLPESSHASGATCWENDKTLVRKPAWPKLASRARPTSPLQAGSASPAEVNVCISPSREEQVS